MRGSLALSLTATLGACATSGNAVVERHLPPLPSYATPVKVQDPKAGDDPIAVAARERAGRVQANKRIDAVGAWYEDVRARYETEK